MKSDVSSSQVDENYYILEKEDLEKLDLIEPTFTYIVCYKTGEVMNKEVTRFPDGDFIYTSFKQR